MVWNEPITGPGSAWAGSGRGEDPPRQSHPVERRAAPPGHVTAEILDPGIFRVRWQDIRLTARRDFDTLLDRWRVVICSTEVAGNSSGGDQFRERVLGLGLGVNEQPVRGDGSTHEYIHTDVHLGDVWVVVVGISVTSLVGFPSTPILVALEGPSTALPFDIPSATLTWLAKTVNGYNVFALFPTYQSPFDMTNFFGMQLYGVNYFGGAEEEELGNMNIFGSGTGGAYSSPWEMHLPQPILATGTAVFAHNSPNVYWASGDPWDVGMLGRPIFIKDFATGDGTWITNDIGVFTDFHTINLGAALFSGTSGTYTWFVPNSVDFYFVAVNRSGGRSATPLVGSPSVSL